MVIALTILNRLLRGKQRSDKLIDRLFARINQLEKEIERLNKTIGNLITSLDSCNDAFIEFEVLKNKYRFHDAVDLKDLCFDGSDIVVIFYRTKHGTILSETVDSMREFNDHLEAMGKNKEVFLGWRFTPNYKGLETR